MRRIRRLARILRAAAAPCGLITWITGAAAQTFTWNNPAGGTFAVASNWSPAGGPPNSATESAAFGPASLYTVTFTSGVTNNNLSLASSFLNFASNTTTTRTYSLAGDATLSSGLLLVGGASRPIALDVADQLVLTSGLLSVAPGSGVTANRMTFAPPTGTGTINVGGSGASFELTGTSNAIIGSSAGDARFTLTDGAAGTFGGAISLAQSSAGNMFAALHVTGGASLTAHSGIRVGATDATNQIAQFFLSGPGSRVTQSGAGTLIIGQTSGTRGNFTVHDGSTFTSGTGTITANSLGTLSVIGGTFHGNGTFLSNGGLIEVDGGALFSNVATVLSGGTVEIGMSSVGTGGGSVTFANSLRVQGGARIAADGGIISAGAATFHSGAELTLSSSAATFGGSLNCFGNHINAGSSSMIVSGPAIANVGGTLEFANSSVRFQDTLRIAGSSSLTVSGGSINVTGPVTINQDDPKAPAGIVSISNGAAATFSSSISVTQGGLLNVSGSTFRTNGNLFVNQGQIDVGGSATTTFHSNTLATLINGAVFNLTGGTATFAGALAPTGAQINVSGGTLVTPFGVTFNGGTLALSGAGTIELEDRFYQFINGAALSAGSLNVGSASLRFADAGKLITTGRVNVVGTISLGQGGQGTVGGDLILPSGGVIIIGGPNAKLIAGGDFDCDGLADLRTGGALEADRLIVGGNGALLVQSGASATFSGSMRIDPTRVATVTGPGSSLRATGMGTSNISGTLAIANGAFAEIGGTITFGAAGGRIEQSGGTFLAGGSILLNKPGAVFQQTGGTFIHDIATIFDIRDGGVADFGGAVHVTATSNIFHVFDGGTLRFNNGVRLGTFGAFGADSGTGSILVDGNAATLSIGTPGATIGFGTDGRGTVEFRNGAAPTIAGPTRVGMNGSVGTFLINTGARATMGDLLVGVDGGSGTFNAFNSATISFGDVNVGVNGGNGTFGVSSSSSITLGNLTVGASGTGLARFGGSTKTQANDASITVGAAPTGPITGRLEIFSGSFRSGTGPINIRPGGSLSISAELRARGPMFDRGANVAITGSGRLDLTDQTRFIDYTGVSPITTVRNQLVSGYLNGLWTGTGIVSSTAAVTPNFALGFAEAGDLFSTFPATFQGQSIDADTILITYTRYGDANLDRVVNLQDFNRLAINFGTPGGATWSMGDFNYDGVVNLQDFNRLAINFGLSAGPDGLVDPQDWAALAAVVPEPAMMGMPLALTSMLHRRRRR